MFFQWFFIYYFIIVSSSADAVSDNYNYGGLDEHVLEAIQLKLAAQNAAWNHIFTFILNADCDDNDAAHPNRIQTEDTGECCLTDHSGRWCRLSRRPGHLQVNHSGDINQLGRPYRPNHHNEVLYDATDWGRSCSDIEAEPLVDAAADSSADALIRNHLNLPALYSVLLNFGMNQKYYQFLVSLQNYQQEHDCRKENEFWDPFASTCREFYCREDDVECLQAAHSHNHTIDWAKECLLQMETIQLTLYADAINNQSRSDPELLQIVQESFTPAFAAFVGIDPNRVFNLSVGFVEPSPGVTPGMEMESLAIDFQLSQASPGSDEPSIDSVVALISSLIVQDHLVVILPGNVAVQLVGMHEQPTASEKDSFDNWCRGTGSEATYFNDEFVISVSNSTTNNQTEFRVYIISTDTWYESGTFLANILFQGSSEKSVNINENTNGMSGYVVVCQNRSVLPNDEDCLLWYLKPGEFEFQDDGSVVYKGDLPFLPPVFLPGEYEAQPDGSLAICFNPDDYNIPTVVLIESYLSTALTCISLVAMILTIITYLLFAELRNLPGLAVLNLCISTFFFQLTFMLGMSFHQSLYRYHHDLCIAIGIIIHYEGLASFFWTNVMAFDLLLTLSRWSAAPRSPSKMLPRYALYAYGVPLLIVSAAITIDFCKCTGNFIIGYGLFLCWIGNPLANFIFFGLPMGLILIANMILFICTICSIQRATTVRTSVNRKQSAMQQLKLYARMSTVMGFCWIFGLAAGALDPISTVGLIFAYIYSITNSLQGFFIFAAFTCNSRVLHLYKVRWAKWTGKQTELTDKRAETITSSRHDRQLKTLSAETIVSHSDDKQP